MRSASRRTITKITGVDINPLLEGNIGGDPGGRRGFQ